MEGCNFLFLEGYFCLSIKDIQGKEKEIIKRKRKRKKKGFIFRGFKTERNINKKEHYTKGFYFKGIFYKKQKGLYIVAKKGAKTHKVNIFLRERAKNIKNTKNTHVVKKILETHK